MTIQDRIWASNIRNLPNTEDCPRITLQETHMIGKTVVIGTKAGTVTKEVEDNATGEVYEVELEDGTTITAGAHEMEVADTAAGTGKPSTDIQAEVPSLVQAEGTGSGDGCGEATIPDPEAEEEEEEVEEGKDEEYEKFFKAALKKFGVDSPADLEGDKKKEFFDYVDKNWKGEKKESVEFSEAEVAHFESILKKKVVDEAESIPLVRTGQGTSQVDTHPKRKDGKVERLYQAKNGRERSALVGALQRPEFKTTTRYNIPTKGTNVEVVFDNDKVRVAYEKRMKIKS